jgi:hypothetical protein
MTSLPQTVMTLPIKEMNTPCDFTQRLLKVFFMQLVQQDEKSIEKSWLVI